jgi:tRNA pseudouridine38-40 synthase
MKRWKCIYEHIMNKLPTPSNSVNLKLIVEYDGTDFHGFQIQPEVRTVQGVLQTVLSRITNAPVKLTTAARTDAGVHARGQVVHFHTVSKLNGGKIHKGANALLPPDVAIRSIETVPDDFHARFSAVSRTYVYCIDNTVIRSPFRRRFALHVPDRLDENIMMEAAREMIGERDFSSFRGAQDASRHSIRRLIRTWCEREDDQIRLYFEANAFLQHMIRNIVGTLLMVGRGKMSIEQFSMILAACDRCKAGPTIRPDGLCLLEVRYPEEVR